MQKTIPYLFLFISFILLGCFPEDSPYPIKPIDGYVGEINESIYDHQSFYNFSENITESSNQNNAWDIGFKNSVAGNHIILNSGDLLSIANLGVVDFTNTDIPEDVQWLYDASSGNLDSLAINNWVNTHTTPYTYSNNIYVIAKNKIPFKKFKLVQLTGEDYTIIISPLDAFLPDTVLVSKNNQLNYSKLSLQNKNTVAPVEPLTSHWDIQFSTYQTIIPDDFAVPTPYVVRGVLLNPEQTIVAKHYVSEDDVPIGNSEENDLEVFFIQFSKENMDEMDYSTALDAIGHTWKNVEIDYDSGTAEYKADLRSIYIIKTQAGEIYKLRFISYYSAGIKGFPKFQYGLLE